MIRTLVPIALMLVATHISSGQQDDPPQFLGAPDASRAVNNRAVTMVSSLAVTPGGRLWATWYAGVTPAEDDNNYVVLATSGDDGATWKEVLVADPDAEGPVRAFDPEIWLAPDGNLYWIWAQTLGHNGAISGVWALKITNPEDPEPSYEQPVRWTDGVMMCKPLVLSTGEWVLPVSTWRTQDDSARMVVSTDGGKTWSVRGACNVPKDVRSFDEHMFVEREDGSLWLLARTKYGMGESISTDRGETWPELTPSAIAHTSSRFFIHRLDSGNLLLVKHGPISEKTGRSHLMAFISTDDGRTWSDGLLLDERETISYPDGQQGPDGTITITYDFSRTGEREILLASFREEDAMAGENVSGEVKLRQLISKGSGGQPKKPAPGEQPSSNAGGAALIKAPAGTFALGGLETAECAPGIKIFTDRAYPMMDTPDALRGFQLVRVPLGGRKELVCEQAGMLYFLTPRPNRNKDSQSATLEAQGFKAVALPEFQLFGPKLAQNYCTLYQKHCEAGEKINIGAWAVPLFLAE
ncbi:exo-alpha-sialidase [Ruficoccus amylovorans]|uniref:Exo-alpha-sialidase n=1 Tax=Ruficoccus amylovorans TaxID=1804625 RepID=A0A842HDD7_9BACT|nr:sialidase family protein [Ruficoccus amylovorans]MBC2594068.1 exo-alpha-sialidase [Ruficoccus amylovorans]